MTGSVALQRMQPETGRVGGVGMESTDAAPTPAPGVCCAPLASSLQIGRHELLSKHQGRE